MLIHRLRLRVHLPFKSSRTAVEKDVFVHISAVERAGLTDLREGTKVTFDIVSNRGKEAAENLRVK
jgi:cold shock CspA family protein